MHYSVILTETHASPLFLMGHAVGKGSKWVYAPRPGVLMDKVAVIFSISTFNYEIFFQLSALI